MILIIELITTYCVWVIVKLSNCLLTIYLVKLMNQVIFIILVDNVQIVNNALIVQIKKGIFCYMKCFIYTLSH